MTTKKILCLMMSLITLFLSVSCNKTSSRDAENTVGLEKPVDNRKIIHAAYCEPSYMVTPHNPYSLKIATFNRGSSEYRIEMESYTEENIMALTADMLSDDAPDIVLGTLIDTDNNSFFDLYEFIDRDDELSRDSFIPGILTALEYKDELHKIWQYFGIYTVSARESDVGGASSLLPEDYIRILENNPDREYILEPWINSKTLLTWVGLIACASYINREDFSCDFKAPGFADLLRWCNSISRDSVNDPDPFEKSILEIQHIQRLARAEFGIPNGYGDDLVYIGFPGDNCPRSYFELMEGCFAIPRTAKEKEGAWKFIKEQLLEERDSRGALGLFDLAGCPVIKSRFEKEYNEINEIRQPQKAEQNAAEKFLSLVYETNKAIDRTDNTVSNIIYEEGKKYLDGDKPLDDVIIAIQSRASVYLSEKGK